MRQELEPAKVSSNTTTIPPLATTLLSVVKVGVPRAVTTLRNRSHMSSGGKTTIKMFVLHSPKSRFTNDLWGLYSLYTCNILCPKTFTSGTGKTPPKMKKPSVGRNKEETFGRTVGILIFVCVSLWIRHFTGYVSAPGNPRSILNTSEVK